MSLAARACNCVRHSLLTLAVAGSQVPAVMAQTVEFRPGARGDPLADEVIEKVLSRGRYTVLIRDTIVAAEDIVGGDLVVLRSSVRIEGTIEGDIVAVQSDVFTRPGGRIQGLVVVLNGGFYGSSLAQVSSPPIEAATLDYRVLEEDDGRYIIAAPGGRVAPRLPGIYGFVLPTYDRVNAVTISWGVELDRGRSPLAPAASGRLRLYTARGKVDGVLELTWPFGRHAATTAGGRTVRSNDQWIIGDFGNSLHSLIGSADLRNYYDARFVDAGIRLNHGTSFRWSHGLTIGWERARSLENEDPFSFFSPRGDFQDNLAVDEGDIGSLKLQTDLRIRAWRRPELDVELDIELADRDVTGDFSFALFGAAIRSDAGTIGDQRLILLARGQIPASDAPRQRWRALGGWRTLPTLDRLEQRGDRMWFLEATYRLPTSQNLGVLGRLEAWAQYSVGNVWHAETPRPSVAHNVGAGLAVGRVALGVYTDPSDDFETVLALGIRRR